MDRQQGIYKITSLSGRVYIGQSVDIKTRFYKYKGLHCEKQFRLHNSLKKYGVNSHIFEVVELCSEALLNERERYYQDLYDATNNDKGLNCVLTATTDKSGRVSVDSKQRMSIAQKGKKISEETRKRMSVAVTGRKHTDEAKENMSVAQSNRSCETRQRMKNNNGMAKKVICIAGSRIFRTIREASIFSGIPNTSLAEKLKGNRKNNTSMRYA